MSTEIWQNAKKILSNLLLPWMVLNSLSQSTLKWAHFRLLTTAKEIIWNTTLLALCVGKPPVTVGFPQKGSVIRKAFTCHDIVMQHGRRNLAKSRGTWLPRSLLLTIMPVNTAMARPQYVLGTISPYPMDKNVIEIIHMEFKKFWCLTSW